MGYTHAKLREGVQSMALLISSSTVRRGSWRWLYALTFTGAVVFLTGFQPSQPAEEPTAEAIEQARLVTRELSQGLQSMLAEELAKGGFAGAVRVCSERAQTITGEFNAAMGASARRVSAKYRNPNGQPDAYEADMLERWRLAHGRKELPEESVEVVRDQLNQRHLRYMKPIVMQAMCLSCHGAPEAIPAEVRTVLGSRYPKDLATGYRAGDLRGAVSVRIPLNGQ